jgi:hypothetical protein
MSQSRNESTPLMSHFGAPPLIFIILRFCEKKNIRNRKIMVETVQERMKRIEEQKKYIKEHEGLYKKAFLK